jgi:endonuclease/exonuclease/phosphatase family metal-dependent hydrolase
VSKGIQSNQARVVRTSLAREASDHLPVVIDFTISVS